jgi:hypothetical protein
MSDLWSDLQAEARSELCLRAMAVDQWMAVQDGELEVDAAGRPIYTSAEPDTLQESGNERRG